MAGGAGGFATQALVFSFQKVSEVWMAAFAAILLCSLLTVEGFG
jgi:hypothetical protein